MKSERAQRIISAVQSAEEEKKKKERELRQAEESRKRAKAARIAAEQKREMEINQRLLRETGIVDLFEDLRDSRLISRPYTPAKLVWSQDKSAIELLYGERISGYTMGGDEEYECKYLRAERSASGQLLINYQPANTEEIDKIIIEKMTSGTNYKKGNITSVSPSKK